LVMCIKPSAERCLLLGGIVFFFLCRSICYCFGSFSFLRKFGWKEGVVIFCAVCSTQFYLLFIFFPCFLLLLLFKIIFH
jgi:hypothetical protein